MNNRPAVAMAAIESVMDHSCVRVVDECVSILRRSGEKKSSYRRRHNEN